MSIPNASKSSGAKTADVAVLTNTGVFTGVDIVNDGGSDVCTVAVHDCAATGDAAAANMIAHLGVSATDGAADHLSCYVSLNTGLTLIIVGTDVNVVARFIDLSFNGTGV